jgi:hypothetical protein
MMRYQMQPGDHVIWLRSPGRSFLTGWRLSQIPAVVVQVCPRRIKIRVFVDSREKTVLVDPDNLILGAEESCAN